MSSMLRISEAASLALHTTVLMADNPDRPMSAKEMAGILQVSEAHLAKVLQRLGHAGLVHATRGPHGGFVLARPGEKVTLREVYEIIEGPMQDCNCLFTTAVCDGRNCILGDLLSSVTREVKTYFSGKTLADLTPAYHSVQGR